MMVQGYAFNSEFWSLPLSERSSILSKVDSLIKEAREELIHLHIYRSLRNDVDLIFWYSSRDIRVLGDFKYSFLNIIGSYVTGSYGSFSVYRESPYLKPGDDLAVTLQHEPSPYFVAYPMSKENSWYQLSYDERKKIMAEHIGVAVSHPENKNIRSYTTYSHGISDGEFMVIYELDDFSKWSSVTARLREVKARVWINNETPILTGTLMNSISKELVSF